MYFVTFHHCCTRVLVLDSGCVCVCVCVCVLCSWRCQVVPSTVGSWHAVRQWSDWSKTTREEQAELPAAISLPVSDGYGQGSQICSARLCYAVRESQCSQGDSVNHSLEYCTGNLTWYLMGQFLATLLSFCLDHWATFQVQCCGTNNVFVMNFCSGLSPRSTTRTYTHFLQYNLHLHLDIRCNIV